MTREEEIRQEVYLRLVGSFGDYTDGYEDGFIEGAKWADENPTTCSERMVGSQSYSKQQLREMGFAFDLNGNVLNPNYLASKAAQYAIEKACKWLEEKLYEHTNMGEFVGTLSRYVYKKDTINQFRKAMEKNYETNNVCFTKRRW